MKTGEYRSSSGRVPTGVSRPAEHRQQDEQIADRRRNALPGTVADDEVDAGERERRAGPSRPARALVSQGRAEQADHDRRAAEDERAVGH